MPIGRKIFLNSRGSARKLLNISIRKLVYLKYPNIPRFTHTLRATSHRRARRVRARAMKWPIRKSLVAVNIRSRKKIPLVL